MIRSASGHVRRPRESRHTWVPRPPAKARPPLPFKKSRRDFVQRKNLLFEAVFIMPASQFDLTVWSTSQVSLSSRGFNDKNIRLSSRVREFFLPGILRANCIARTSWKGANALRGKRLTAYLESARNCQRLPQIARPWSGRELSVPPVKPRTNA